MEDLSKYSNHVEIPTHASKIYKDECAYSFHTQESKGGLMIDLASFVGFSPDYALLNYRLTGHTLYLNISKFRIPKKIVEGESANSAASLASLDLDFDYEEEYGLVLLPSYSRFDFSPSNFPPFFPLKLQQCITRVIELNSSMTNLKADLIMPKDELMVSRYALDLQQLANGVVVPSSGWKCEKCGIETNLWLNLTDGSVLCGRRQLNNFGGNNHAFEHYQETGYCLAVKLGTITPEGDADVYSYAPDEDDMVQDPYLERHLLHWGIRLEDMKKTDKSIAELEVLYQSSFEWKLILEDDKELVPIYGSGYTGLINLGNSCYMNSVVQVLFSIPEFQRWYSGEGARYIWEHPMNAVAPEDLEVQLSKLGEGLLSGNHSRPPASELDGEEGGGKCGESNGIRPSMFKAFVGRGHYEFSTNRQQDAVEFFQYLLEMVHDVQMRRLGDNGENGEQRLGDNGENGNLVVCNQLFNLELVYKLTIESTGEVKYNATNVYYVSLPVVVENARNYEEWKMASGGGGDGESAIFPIIDLKSCFDKFVSPGSIDDLLDPNTRERVGAMNEIFFGTFPPYLAIQVSKFTRDANEWTPKKIEIMLDVPDEINLEEYRSDKHRSSSVDDGSQSGIGMDDIAMKPENLKGNDRENAMEKKTTPPNSLIDRIMEMGFTRNRARRALSLCSNSLEDALEWLFTYQDDIGIEDLDDFDNPTPSTTPSGKIMQIKPKPIDGPADYSLFAFISHIGPSTTSGHYVVHIKKNDKWVLFNDEKVGLSQKLPKEFGYFYFYKRK